MRTTSVTKIKTREFTGEDIEKIANLAKVFLSDNKNWVCEKAFSNLLERIREVEGIFGRVAYCGNEFVGFIFGDMRRIWFREPDSAWLLMIYVVPKCRKKGIGRRLLAEFLEQAREHGFRKIYAPVEVADPGTIKFLEKMGFKKGRYIQLEKQI